MSDLREYAKTLVRSAPPLTDGQRSRIAAVLTGKQWTRGQQVTDWLSRYINAAGGSVATGQCARDAEKAGITGPELIKAKDALGVRVTQGGRRWLIDAERRPGSFHTNRANVQNGPEAQNRTHNRKVTHAQATSAPTVTGGVAEGQPTSHSLCTHESTPAARKACRRRRAAA